MNARRLSGCTTICARALPVHVFDVPKLAPNVTYQGNNKYIRVAVSSDRSSLAPFLSDGSRIAYIGISQSPMLDPGSSTTNSGTRIVFPQQEFR